MLETGLAHRGQQCTLRGLRRHARCWGHGGKPGSLQRSGGHGRHPHSREGPAGGPSGSKASPSVFRFCVFSCPPPPPPFTVSFSVVSVPRGPPWPENVKLKIPELNGPSIPRGAMKPCAIRPRPPGRGSPLGPRVRTADPRAASHSAAASVIRCPVLLLGQPPILRNDGPKRRSRDSGIRGCPREARALYEAACGRGQRHL